MTQIRSPDHTQLMQIHPLIPQGTPPLNNRNHLVRNTMGKRPPERDLALLLARGIDDPLNRRSSPLPDRQRNGDHQRDASASGAPLCAHADERGQRVHGEGEVGERVEREVAGRRVAGEEGSVGAEFGRWGVAELVEDDRDVLKRRLVR